MITFNPRVAVLVLGYNHQASLADTLTSAANQTYTNYTLSYIDNASQDTSVAFVREQFPGISIITHAHNLGYAEAYRRALNHVFQSGFDAAVLLNPDTIVDNRWLEELVQSAYASDDIAFAQPKIYLWKEGRKTTTFNTAGNRIHFLGFGYCGRYQEEDEPPLENDVDITTGSGASLFIKKSVYKQLPGLDTSFFAYLEDQDLNWQARLLGYRHVLSAHSIMWHKYDFEKKHLNTLKFYLLERNRLTFLLKYYSPRLLLLILPAFCIMEVGMLFDALQRGYFFDKLRSYRDALVRLPKTLRARKHLQALRTKTDRELFLLLSPTISFEAVDSPLLRLANRFFLAYATIIRRLL